MHRLLDLSRGGPHARAATTGAQSPVGAAAPCPAGSDQLSVAIEPNFDFASPEYDALHRQSAATAFQAPGWLDALHRQVAPAMGAVPVTVVVRAKDDGRPLLVLPLAHSRKRRTSFLEFADFGLCDYVAPIYDQRYVPLLLADTSLRERISALLPRCDVIAFTKLAGADPILERLFPTARRAFMRMSAYAVTLGTDWETWRSETIDRSFRRQLDTHRRRLARSGTPTFALVRDEPEIARLFDTMRAFRAERFKRIGAADMMAMDAVFSFYRDVAIAGAESGSARTYALYLSGDPVGVLFGLFDRGTFCFILLGFDVIRRHRPALGNLTVEDTMRAALEAGDRIYDLTIGDHAYKTQFGADKIDLYEWHVARTVRGWLAVLAIQAEREAKRHLKPWFKRKIPPRTPAAKDS
jgi:CelD/BcsL family acetyltransferase involved in cellulose biosynthesis